MTVEHQKVYPLQIDFVVISVNDAETDAIKKIFQFDQRTPEHNEYKWRMLINSHKQHVVIAHIPLDDKTGSRTLLNIKQAINLHPQYILVLGTAGGRDINAKGGPSDQSEQPCVGHVVVSEFIHCHNGMLERKPRTLPVFPPHEKLLSIARHIQTEKIDWWKRIEAKRPEENGSNKTQVIITEIITTDKTFSDFDKDLRYLWRVHPRSVAVEQEGGFVGNAIYDSFMKNELVPGYLVIKGISDIPQITKKKKNDSTDENQGGIRLQPTKDSAQETRDAWKKYSSEASAAYAYELIWQVNMSRRPPAVYDRLIPNNLKSRVEHNDRARVVCGVNEKAYSEISTQLSQKFMSTVGDNFPTLFTVFPYSPKKIYDICVKAFLDEGNEINKEDFPKILKDGLPDKRKDLLWASYRAFSHFDEFRAYAQEHVSARIVCTGDLKLQAERMEFTQEHWNFFKELMNGVPCWVMKPGPPSEDKPCLDHVILNGRIVLNWSLESSMLVLTDLGLEPELHFNMLLIYEKFTKHQELWFEELDFVDQKVQDVFAQKSKAVLS